MIVHTYKYSLLLGNQVNGALKRALRQTCAVEVAKALADLEALWDYTAVALSKPRRWRFAFLSYAWMVANYCHYQPLFTLY